MPPFPDLVCARAGIVEQELPILPGGQCASQGEASVPLHRPTIIDLTRSLSGFAHASPTGIDRVELAYARWLLSMPGERFGLVSTPLRPFVLDRTEAVAIVDALASQWGECKPPEADPLYQAVRARLGLKPTGAPPAKPRRSAVRRWGSRAQAWTHLLKGGTPSALPRNALYLHMSHVKLHRPERFAWLRRRPDIRAVFFVHDLIPIHYPEFSRANADTRHRARIETIARHAAHVLVGSHEVRRVIQHHWRDRPHQLPVTTVPLGIEDAFQGNMRTDAAPPYFVVCGTTDPRKNHLLLLQVWRRLAEDGGPSPKLVVAGRRGWASDGANSVLDKAAFARDHVIEAAGLSTPAMAQLMREARAVLVPSFCEGYSFPVLEGLSLGRPVVASDIPAHREIAQGRALLLDPLDEPAWIDAIRSLSDPARVPDTKSPAQEEPFRPPTWEAHFAAVAKVLSALN